MAHWPSAQQVPGMTLHQCHSFDVRKGIQSTKCYSTSEESLFEGGTVQAQMESPVPRYLWYSVLVVSRPCDTCPLDYYELDVCDVVGGTKNWKMPKSIRNFLNLKKFNQNQIFTAVISGTSEDYYQLWWKFLQPFSRYRKMDVRDVVGGTKNWKSVEVQNQFPKFRKVQLRPNLCSSQ